MASAWSAALARKRLAYRAEELQKAAWTIVGDSWHDESITQLFEAVEMFKRAGRMDRAAMRLADLMAATSLSPRVVKEDEG